MRRAVQVWLVLALLAGAALFVSIGTGSTRIPVFDVVRLLFSDENNAAWEVVLRLRVPRTLAAFATGGLLALAGALMQALLRNPLADPYVLGLSGGSALGALVAMMLGVGSVFVDFAAFSGALLSMALVFAIANRDFVWLQAAGEADASPRLLLIGVVLAAGWSALVTVLLTLAPEGKLRGILFWLMGDLSAAGSFAYPLAALGVALLVIYPFARELNVMLRGPTVAHSLGVPVARLRLLLYFVASLA